MSIVEVAGTVVHYHSIGEGPGLMLVHGSSIDAATNFGGLVEQFADRRTVITPDYAGSGKTTLPDGELTAELLVAQMAAVADHAATGPVDVVGFSLGAVVAAALTARHPDLVRRLVLVAGWVDSTDPRLRLGLSTWRRLLDIDADLYASYGLLVGASPAFLGKFDEQTLATLRALRPAPGTAAQIDLDLRIDIRDELAEILVPTLVVGCTQDHLVPVKHARLLHEGIAGSEYTEMDSGHVVFAEQPDAIANVIREFIHRGESASGANGPTDTSAVGR